MLITEEDLYRYLKYLDLKGEELLELIGKEIIMSDNRENVSIGLNDNLFCVQLKKEIQYENLKGFLVVNNIDFIDKGKAHRNDDLDIWEVQVDSFNLGSAVLMTAATFGELN